MGRPVGLTETGPGTVWVKNAAYGPGGEMRTMQYRREGSQYYTENRTYNKRTQLTGLQTVDPLSAGMNLQYGYGAGAANNGQISQVTEVISGEQVAYTYDSLKRLIKAETLQPGGTHWGQSFGYDGFGNLLTKNPTAGHTGTTMSLTVDAATNRLTTAGFSHDANGNMTGMPAVPHNLTLAYDVENWTGGGYFDQQNQPLYRDGQWNLYGLRGERLGLYKYTVTVGINWYMGYPYYYALADATQTWRNIYFGGRLIVSNGTTVVTDPVGSVRTDANSNGALFGYYPYGENIGNSRGAGGEQFATYTRESGTGLDYAVSRYYTAIYGRFNTPDRYQNNAPQKDSATWNRYSYAQGDPVNLNDPRGSFTCYDCGEDGSLACAVGYHWDAYSGRCESDNPGLPPSKGEDSHPDPPPVCNIQLFDQPAVFGSILGFQNPFVHTYLGITIGYGSATQYVEAGPSPKDPKFTSASDATNGNSWLNNLNDSQGVHAYDTPSSNLFQTGFNSLNCLQANAVLSRAGSFPQGRITYNFPSPNSNSFTFSLIKDALIALPFSLTQLLTGPVSVGPITFQKAPGWGVYLCNSSGGS
jgi:RHS repeat-associated protein